MSKLLRYICDRMNGAKYGTPEFYWWLKENLEPQDAEPICSAIDSDCESNVRKAIQQHFENHQLYPLALHYVSAVRWLTDDPEQSNALEYSTFVTMHSTEHDEDTPDDDYEIEATCHTDARRTLRQQVWAAYQQALDHGHHPWRAIFIELPPNRFRVDGVSIRPVKNCRDQLKAVFTKAHERNRNYPMFGGWSIIIPDVNLNIHVCRNSDYNGTSEDLSFERKVTLNISQQHISARPREWYLQNAK